MNRTHNIFKCLFYQQEKKRNSSKISIHNKFMVEQIEGGNIIMFLWTEIKS